MDIGIPISGKTKITALIGSPISHSLSPALHNASFIHTKTDAVFVALEVQPDSLETTQTEDLPLLGRTVSHR